VSKVETIRKYYDLWIAANRTGMEDLIAEEIIYTESYGPQHHGISEIIKWFDDWNQKARVICWDIINWIEQDNLCIVEWFFQFEIDGKEIMSDGASIVEFDTNNKIVNMREFQSTHEHYYPYKDTKGKIES